ncbi:OadG family protein [Aliarcobacter butzleri]|uniref:OadG family protein n=2 Tax=Aliarcobacter butzleri TaxID=28197 RepID=UPI0021B678C2|nr:OadG family protein [Aliarcobacter butzleri]MCT7593101.1 OadG family protein [Aliarcobacter butzleri]
MDALVHTLSSFLIVMGIVSTVLLILGFLLKAKGVTFVEFFPKKQENVSQTPNIIYNTITNPVVSNSGIDPRKVAAIMAAIQHHTKLKG